MQSHAVTAQSAHQFVQRLLEEASAPSTLIVCSSRQHFLDDLQPSTTQYHESEVKPDEAPYTRNKDDFDLTANTLQLIRLSSRVRITYTPTLQHLRAYLSTFQTRPSSSHVQDVADQTRSPLLAIWGLVNLHRSTSDYSAQGLSRSLSLAVETAHLAKLSLLVAEPTRHDQSQVQGIDSPWEAEIPLLSGSTRIDGDRRKLAGQVLAIADVVGRWCTIVD